MRSLRTGSAVECFVVEFRFYAELGDFLSPRRRGRSIKLAVAGHQTVKHVVEVLGVPHTEVGLLLINGEPAAMASRLAPGDRVAVLPTLRCLTAAPCGELRRFAADSHLGRLARYLRFAGFDTLWDNGWDDANLVAVAGMEGRIVLSRDRALLMHKALLAGCYLRDKEPLAQLSDVASRYALDLCGKQTGRCLECNTPLLSVPKEEVAAQLLPGTLEGFDVFWRCPDCSRVFWQGSHWKRMRAVVDAVGRMLKRERPEAPDVGTG
jgi:uncharacterized protein with PIN domain